MNQPICPNCGANAFVLKDGKKICKYCNSIYVDSSPQQKTEVSLGSDVERLLAKCKADPKNAPKYAGLILDIDPTNKEAMKYL